jgi:hypothetical protein
VVFTQSALDDLKFLKKNDQVGILDAIEQRLTAEPLGKREIASRFVPMTSRRGKPGWAIFESFMTSIRRPGR